MIDVEKSIVLPDSPVRQVQFRCHLETQLSALNQTVIGSSTTLFSRGGTLHVTFTNVIGPVAQGAIRSSHQKSYPL